MRALLTRRVEIAWLLLATALSGALLVIWLSLQSTSSPGGSVYIVRAAATSVAGRGGAPPEQPAVAVLTTPQLVEPTAAPESSPTRGATAVPASPTSTAESPAPTAQQPTRVPQEPAPPSPVAQLPEPTATPSDQSTGAPIDINASTAEELEMLPGIGPVLAKRIVEDRKANGPFATVDDLDRVKGIGEGILAKVRGHVVAGR